MAELSPRSNIDSILEHLQAIERRAGGAQVDVRAHGLGELDDRLEKIKRHIRIIEDVAECERAQHG